MIGNSNQDIRFSDIEVYSQSHRSNSQLVDTDLQSKMSQDKNLSLLSENKKLVYMSHRVLEEIQLHQITTGTDIATKIMQTCSLKLDFKNVQRRVYDALNVLCALGVTTKSKNQI